MAKKKSTTLYGIARAINKIASFVNDVETVATGDTKKIAKRAKRKVAGKAMNKVNREIMKKL